MKDRAITLVRKASSNALAGAYLWLVAFFVVGAGRPQDFIRGLSTIPLAKITGLLALIALVPAIGKARPKFAREMIYLFLLLGQLGLAALFSPVWRGGALQTVMDFSKVVPVAMVMILVVSTFKRFRLLLFIQSAFAGVGAALSVWQETHPGGRLQGVFSSNTNSNYLALSMAISLPLCLVFLFQSRSRLRKAAWAMLMLVMTYAIFLTASRSGLLALIAVTLVCVWEFAVRGRRRYLIAIVTLAGIVFSLYASQGLMRRLSSQDESAEESSRQRQELLTKSLKVTAEHPLFGVGPGNFTVVSGVWRVTHNAYTQMSSEGGLPALLLYLLILWSGFANVRSIKRMGGQKLTTFASGLKASLVGVVVGGFFTSLAYESDGYCLVFFTTVLYQIARHEWALNDSQDNIHRQIRIQATLEDAAPGRSSMANA